jgi:hypothetical protein
VLGFLSCSILVGDDSGSRFVMREGQCDHARNHDSKVVLVARWRSPLVAQPDFCSEEIVSGRVASTRLVQSVALVAERVCRIDDLVDARVSS